MNKPKNFRDVGRSINLIAKKKIFPEKTLFRSGKLDNITDHEDIQNIPTIINLRKKKDNKLFLANYLYFPAQDNAKIYDADNKTIRKWINKIIKGILSEDVNLPILLHCTSGKDRSGMVVSAILAALKIDRKFIIKEYLLSEGDLDSRHISNALKAFTPIENYVNKNNITKLRQKFFGNTY